MSQSIPSLDSETLKKAVKSLKGMSVHPKCSNHKPEATLVDDEYGYMVVVNCPNCGFTMYCRPDSFSDIVFGNTGGVIDILKNG